MAKLGQLLRVGHEVLSQGVCEVARPIRALLISHLSLPLRGKCAAERLGRHRVAGREALGGATASATGALARS
jgi:hypothetical protein